MFLIALKLIAKYRCIFLSYSGARHLYHTPYSLHSPGRPLTADVFRDAFDISGHVGRHTIGTWVHAEYQYKVCVLWPYMWHIDGCLFLRRKNVTLTTGHDILELFVVLEIDSSTIIIQNEDTVPHFDGIFREFHGEFLQPVACFSFLSCLFLE